MSAAAACWLAAVLWGGAALPPARGYVVLSPVSWPLPEGDGPPGDELHSASTEEALPALLEEASSLWKQSDPASAYREHADLGAGPAARRAARAASPARMFSYRRESAPGPPPPPPERAAAARLLARHSTWGFVATQAAQGKIQGMPYGNCLLVSDGPINNSTGIPFFYVTPKDKTVADLLKNPVASLTLPEVDGNFCRANSVQEGEFTLLQMLDIPALISHSREAYPTSKLLDQFHAEILQRAKVTTKTISYSEYTCLELNTELGHGLQIFRKNVIDPEDPRCTRLTLTGQMVTVPPEEVEFAKQAMFSRHPVIRKWPRNYEWFFLKMNIEHIWLQSWYGEVSTITVEEYLKAIPSKA